MANKMAARTCNGKMDMMVLKVYVHIIAYYGTLFIMYEHLGFIWDL